MFAVDGSALPEVDFNVGESYAGTLSIDSNPDNFNRLWFWFFPSENPAASDEIAIWLNGGPGCSSLDGLFQENGPFLWQSGTYAPIKNPYAWTNLTNMVWFINYQSSMVLSNLDMDRPASINWILSRKCYCE